MKVPDNMENCKDRYFVLEMAKTKMSVISKKIQNAFELDSCHLELKEIPFFENLFKIERSAAAKTFFNHWYFKLHLFIAMFITRYSCAKVINRLQHIAPHFFSNHETSGQNAIDWVGLFNNKEDNLDSIQEVFADLKASNEIDASSVIYVIRKICFPLLSIIPEETHILFRNENFFSDKFECHLHANSFFDQPSLSNEFNCTNWSVSNDDWSSSLSSSDLHAQNNLSHNCAQKFGYELAITVIRNIHSETCSQNVGQIIKDAHVTKDWAS